MAKSIERQVHLSAKEMLQIRADELHNQQRMGVAINERVVEEIESTGQLNVGVLISGNRRLERARTDALWLSVLVHFGKIKPRRILKIMKKKDELSRFVDEANQEIQPDEETESFED